jgi:hypothetical protein
MLLILTLSHLFNKNSISINSFDLNIRKDFMKNDLIFKNKLYTEKILTILTTPSNTSQQQSHNFFDSNVQMFALHPILIAVHNSIASKLSSIISSLES